ncbi:MAG: Hsp20/alpha crystallin family protein [Vicinamibacterales bacterium]
MASTTLTRGHSALEPFGMMRRLSSEMDRLFGGLPRLVAADPFEGWAPDVETFARNGQFVVRADLPGLSEKDVKVEVLANRLTISGERTQEKETKEADYYASERSYGAFTRTMALPEGANADQATATFKQGVLEVVVPMPPTKTPAARSVEVKKA